MKWWAGLRKDSIVIVYSSSKPSYLTKVTKGYNSLNSLIRNSELRFYSNFVSSLVRSI